MSAGGSAWIADTRIVGFGFHVTTSRSISKIATGNPTDETGSLSETTSSKGWAGRRAIRLRSLSTQSFVRLTGRQRRSRNETSAPISEDFIIVFRRNEILHSIWRNAFGADAHPVSGDLHWARQPEEVKLRLRIE